MSQPRASLSSSPTPPAKTSAAGTTLQKTTTTITQEAFHHHFYSSSTATTELLASPPTFATSIATITLQETEGSIAYPLHSKAKTTLRTTATITTAPNSFDPPSSQSPPQHRYHSDSNRYRKEQGQEQDQDQDQDQDHRHHLCSPELSKLSISPTFHFQPQDHYLHHRREDHGYFCRRDNPQDRHYHYQQQHLSTGGSMNATGHSSDQESDYWASSSLSSPPSSIEPPSRPPGTSTATRLSRQSSLSMASPSSPSSLLSPSSSSSCVPPSSSLPSLAPPSSRPPLSPRNSSGSSGSGNAQLPPFSADLSQERSLAASILIALADQQGDEHEDMLQQQQKQQQQQSTATTSLPLPLPSPQPLLSPLPPHDRRVEQPMSPMDHHYSPRAQPQQQHHVQVGRGSSSLRSSPEYFGHHHHHYSHQQQQQHRHEEYRDHKEHGGHHHYRDQPAERWSYSRSPGPTQHHSSLSATSPSEGFGSQHLRYPSSSSISRPSSPPPLHYERRRSPSFDDAMPPRKRHHGAWNPTDGTARPAPLSPLLPPPSPLNRSGSFSHSHHHHHAQSHSTSSVANGNGDGLSIKTEPTTTRGRIGSVTYSNGIAHSNSTTEFSKAGVSYSGPPSGPKLPAPTPGASVSSSSMPTGKRASLAGSSKTTHAPLGGAATPIASTATPSPKASSTPTNMTHPMDHYLNHNNSNHRRTSTTTTTATPTPEQETPPPSSSSASHNGTTKIHTLTPAEEVEEELTKKRFKNTLAARRSRAKKVMILEQERLRATELETANKALQIRVAVLEAEQKQWAVIKEAQALRIARLEEELARARQVIKERE